MTTYQYVTFNNKVSISSLQRICQSERIEWIDLILTIELDLIEQIEVIWIKEKPNSSIVGSLWKLILYAIVWKRTCFWNVMKRGILTESPLCVVSQPPEKLVTESRKFCSVGVCGRGRGWQSHPLDSPTEPYHCKGKS